MQGNKGRGIIGKISPEGNLVGPGFTVKVSRAGVFLAKYVRPAWNRLKGGRWEHDEFIYRVGEHPVLMTAEWHDPHGIVFNRVSKVGYPEEEYRFTYEPVDPSTEQDGEFDFY